MRPQPARPRVPPGGSGAYHPRPSGSSGPKPSKPKDPAKEREKALEKEKKKEKKEKKEAEKAEKAEIKRQKELAEIAMTQAAACAYQQAGIYYSQVVVPTYQQQMQQSQQSYVPQMAPQPVPGYAPQTTYITPPVCVGPVDYNPSGVSQQMPVAPIPSTVGQPTATPTAALGAAQPYAYYTPMMPDTVVQQQASFFTQPSSYYNSSLPIMNPSLPPLPPPSVGADPEPPRPALPPPTVETEALDNSTRQAVAPPRCDPISSIDLSGFVLGRDGRYIDQSFPAGPMIVRDKTNPHKQLELSGHRITHWLRPHEIWPSGKKKNGSKSGAALFKDGASTMDIEQGGLGDCWLLSSMSCVCAQMPNFIYDMVRGLDSTGSYVVGADSIDMSKGLFGIRLCIYGVWREIWIDDLLPVEQFQGSSGKHEYRMVFTHAKDGEFWIPIFEKAAAKALGGYGSLKGGLGSEGLALMTGGVPQILKLSELTEEKFWQDYLCRTQVGTQGGILMTASGERDTQGLISGHAYSLVGGAQVYSPMDGCNVRLIQVHNPWGEQEWTGDWSDRDRRRWTPEMKRQLQYVCGDDGLFWMSLRDFFRYFTRVSTCEVMPSSWQSTVLGGVMRNISTDSPKDNPAWEVRAVGKHDVHLIVVTRAYDLDIAGNHVAGDAMIGTNITSKASKGAVSRQFSNYSVTVRITLKAGDTFILEPACIRDARNRFNFTLRVLSDQPVTTKAIRS